MYYAKSTEEYLEIKAKVIEKSQEYFGEETTKQIAFSMDEKYKNINPSFKSDKEKNAQTSSKDNMTNTSFAETENTGMFGNIGEKIKTLAQVVCWIGIIACIISVFAMISIDEDFVLWGFVVMILGSLISWVSSFTLYGFGELIDNSKKIVDLLKK